MRTLLHDRRGRRAVLAALITPVVVASVVLFGATPASAEKVATSYGYGYAHQDSHGFFGDIRDTTTPDGYCVEMQRKTRNQDWVTSGFRSGWAPNGGKEIHVVACSTTFVKWHIPQPDTVFGLRMRRYSSGPSAVFCDGWENCVNLL